MNIFFLSLIPRYCARYHCDKHVVKMIVECCQMLWTAFHLTGKKNWLTQVPKNMKVYKVAHVNHPMCIWVRSDKNNFKWTAKLARELCKQYTKRYGKVHSCYKMVRWFNRNIPRCDEDTTTTSVYCKYNYPEGCTPPPLCIPQQEYHSRDLVKAYRKYYQGEKINFAKWRYSRTPYWW